MRKTLDQVVKTIRHHRVELAREDLLRLLAGDGVTVDRAAQIFVQVPGGGDWSGTDLEVSDGRPVVITWTTEETERG